MKKRLFAIILFVVFAFALSAIEFTVMNPFNAAVKVSVCYLEDGSWCYSQVAHLELGEKRVMAVTDSDSRFYVHFSYTGLNGVYYGIGDHWDDASNEGYQVPYTEVDTSESSDGKFLYVLSTDLDGFYTGPFRIAPWNSSIRNVINFETSRNANIEYAQGEQYITYTAESGLNRPWSSDVFHVFIDNRLMGVFYSDYYPEPDSLTERVIELHSNLIQYYGFFPDTDYREFEGGYKLQYGPDRISMEVYSQISIIGLFHPEISNEERTQVYAVLKDAMSL